MQSETHDGRYVWFPTACSWLSCAMRTRATVWSASADNLCRDPDGISIGSGQRPGPPCGCRPPLALPISHQPYERRRRIRSNPCRPPLTRNFAPPTENRAVQKPHAATTRGYGRSRRHNWVWKSAGCRDSTPLGPRRTRCRTRRRIRRKNDSLGNEAVRCSKMFHAD